MNELKLKIQPAKNVASSPCCCFSTPGQKEASYPWVAGTVKTPAGNVLKVTTEITPSERWEHFKCRASGFRNSYTVPPGLYAAGEPGMDSHVLVSANYKLSFDVLRRE